MADEIAASGETPVDAEEAARRLDREDFAFLAREFLTWLVFHVEEGGGEFPGDGAEVEPFRVGFGGKVVLRTLAGLVTDMTIKGPSPVGSADLRYALAGGLSVKETELVMEQGDRAYTFAIAAEHFDLKRVKLPDPMAEADDGGERDPDIELDSRLGLLADLDAALRHAFAMFLSLRLAPIWSREVVPAIRAWLERGT